MKKGFPLTVVFCLMFLFISLPANSFVLKGLQPVQPNGVFSSFSASTPERGVFSMGLDLERSIEIDYYRTTLKAGYAITSNTEILLSVPYMFEWNGDIDGFEDVSVGIKQNFFREKKYGPSVAYLLKVAFLSDEDEFSTDGSAGAGLIVSKKLGPFTAHLNFLYSEPFDDAFDEQMEIIFGMDLKAAHDLDILAELYAVDSYFTDSFETFEGRLGYRIRTTDNIYTILGAGYEFKNRDPEFRLMVSFNFLFGNNI